MKKVQISTALFLSIVLTAAGVQAQTSNQDSYAAAHAQHAADVRRDQAWRDQHGADVQAYQSGRDQHAADVARMNGNRRAQRAYQHAADVRHFDSRRIEHAADVRRIQAKQDSRHAAHERDEAHDAPRRTY